MHKSSSTLLISSFTLLDWAGKRSSGLCANSLLATCFLNCGKRERMQSKGDNCLVCQEEESLISVKWVRLVFDKHAIDRVLKHTIQMEMESLFN